MIQLFAGLEQYSCDACGALGSRPTFVFRHKDGSRLKICTCCAKALQQTEKFKNGVKAGEVELVPY